jgi:hypothetical protein
MEDHMFEQRARNVWHIHPDAWPGKSSIATQGKDKLAPDTCHIDAVPLMGPGSVTRKWKR